MRVGDRVALQLYENAATGYRWSLENVDNKLVFVHEDGDVRRTQGVGGGSTVQWTLEAKATSTTKINLKRWRRWEGEVSVQERFAVTLIIRRGNKV